MKKRFKYILIVLVTAGFISSCEQTDLDLRVSPNDLAADQADPNLVLNAIQLAYASNMYAIGDLGSELTRIDYMFGRDYFNNYPGNTFSAIWARTYSSGTNIPGRGVAVGIFSNVAALEDIDANSDIDYSFHVGVGKTLKAHMLMLLVDYLGKTALSEAGNAAEFPAPNLDEGEAVYQAALSLLDDAEALFTDSAGPQGASDLFYDGDLDKWQKLVNTIRLKAYVTTGDVASFNTIVNSGDYISSNEDDFQFTYGSSELQPDTRHPDYASDYTPSGANIYQSNWLMETMLDNNDPRIRYYFYRQVDETPGADADPNEETLACSLVTPPQHYVDGNYTYCSVGMGYWGRSHGNDEGTPPDNFLRTAVGVYPAAGRFDDNSFDVVGLGLGGGGAGIEPIILSAYVDFWRAEIAAMQNQPAANVAALIRSGLEKHIDKVMSFGSLDPGADLNSFAPTSSEVDDYLQGIEDSYVAGTSEEQMNILGEQYFITQYGSGTEAYNFYRRTGYPTTVLPSWEPDPGAFPRSFLYPQNEVITNPNLDQKQTLTEQVFWDTNPPSPTFPVAN
ncbi:SusD/RagB family nutrient-binding outer membrane lipoprotein [Leeuwenhoekiella nanhaiensis]|uniref:SusD/RagB family nutrient-binding outer membrane lipoprotein n=1 Tax=Leeuwenhoekiella nanhaiensis TaxID=1655491 RepID=A0A2G1VRQ9_9FLAO|nr:SusD/RagB family nutrient-binding outer membrane lipoprotein [Leeuwenhoekiella nanhaiensis]PHQ29468.1 SusD/RagB family nutrient-binding outer membrane lipoprotein [Leeuwenhoekiella nanhaiensis]